PHERSRAARLEGVHSGRGTRSVRPGSGPVEAVGEPAAWRTDGCIRKYVMKLATLKDGTRDGSLVVVSRGLTACAAVPDIARTLQAALDDWAECEPALQAVSNLLNNGEQPHARDFDPEN